MASSKLAGSSQVGVISAEKTPVSPRASQLMALAAYHPPPSPFADTSQTLMLAAIAPPQSKYSNASQDASLIAYSSGLSNADAYCSQYVIMAAYSQAAPVLSRQAAWTFILDGHRFYVLPLGPEGDWAYDTTTKQWCQFQSQGYDGMNFTHGVMWDIRIIGGDAINGTLYELDPTNSLDESWRPIEHIVTGGVQTRNLSMVSVGNFRITATSGDLQEVLSAISLRWSDDNGATWSGYIPIILNQGDYSQVLVWSSLGAFQTPGRIFEISDEAGLVSIYGADARLVLPINNDPEDANDG